MLPAFIMLLPRCSNLLEGKGKIPTQRRVRRPRGWFYYVRATAVRAFIFAPSFVSFPASLLYPFRFVFLVFSGHRSASVPPWNSDCFLAFGGVSSLRHEKKTKVSEEERKKQEPKEMQDRRSIPGARIWCELRLWLRARGCGAEDDSNLFTNAAKIRLRKERENSHFLLLFECFPSLPEAL